MDAGRAPPALPSRRPTAVRDAPRTDAGRAPPDLPPRRRTVAGNAPPVHGAGGQAPPDLPPRRHTVEGNLAPVHGADQAPPPRPITRQVLSNSAPPMDDGLETPAFLPRPQTILQGAKPRNGGLPPPPLPARRPVAQGAAPPLGAGQVPPVLPPRPDPIPSSSSRAPPGQRVSEGGNAPRAGPPFASAAGGARHSAPSPRSPPPSYEELAGGKNKRRFTMEDGVGGLLKGIVGGGKSSEGKDSNEEDEVSEMEKKRDKLQYAEYVINGADYARQFRGYADLAEQGAQVVEDGAQMTQEADAAADVDWDQVGEAVQNVSHNPDVAGAVGGATTTLEGMAADQIVDGHKYHECIDNTCLEEPVRCVAENCAIPMYKFLGETCCRCWCSNGAKENIEATREGADQAENVADGAGEGLGHAENCFSSLCGCCDMCEYCVADEALAYALPFCGLVFSLLRLYQGSRLSLRSFLGMRSAVDKDIKTGFQWMMAEGHARLWQGCCGLLGAAPGLIIVTLPSILACSLVAKKARKNRLLLEKKGDPDAEEAIDPETGERMAVVTAQPLPFPSPEERKSFYDQAYKAVSGRLTLDQNTPQELLEGHLIPEKTYPEAPRGQWSSGVFDCTQHTPSCVTGCCCPCITTGQVAEGARLFQYAFYVTVAVYVFGGLGTPGALLWLIFGTYIVAVSRARVAEVYGIPLNQVENWCLSLWCNCCVATQVARHLFAWGKFDGECAGWCECGPTPVSKWPTLVNRNSSFSSSSRSVRQAYLVPEGYNITVVHAPAAVAPMAR